MPAKNRAGQAGCLAKVAPVGEQPV